MKDPLKHAPTRERLGRWWTGLSTRGRERILLGTLVGVALAARDLLLLVSSAGALAALEAADLMSAPERVQPAA